jgi:aa3 type cytochrome c oxidase subunit IV
MATLSQPPTPAEDWAEHQRTYKGFVRGVLLFAAHVLVILLILAWVFSDSLGTTPVAS